MHATLKIRHLDTNTNRSGGRKFNRWEREQSNLTGQHVERRTGLLKFDKEALFTLLSAGTFVLTEIRTILYMLATLQQQCQFMAATAGVTEELDRIIGQTFLHKVRQFMHNCRQFQILE